MDIVRNATPPAPTPPPPSAAADPPPRTGTHAPTLAAPDVPPPADAAPEGAAETPPDEAKPETPAEGKLLASVRAREKKLTERSALEASRRAEFEAYKTKTEEGFAQYRSRDEQAKQDPIAYLKAVHGWDEASIARRLLGDGSHEPAEAMTKLERELAEMREERAAEKKARAEQEREAGRQRELERFHSEAEAAAADYPRVASIPKARRERMAWDIAIEHSRGGVILTNAEILDKLEEELADLGVSAHPSGKGAPAAPAAKPASKTAAATSESSADSKTPAPTLTSRGAGEVSSDDLEAMDPLKMSHAQTRELLKRRLARIKENGPSAK